MTFGPSLQLATGPECPYCSCRDSRILHQPSSGEEGGWFARQNGGQALCGHCQRLFSFSVIPEPVAPIAEPEAVDEALEGMEFEAADQVMHEVTKPRDTAYPVRGCPECGSPDVVVKSSPKPKVGMPKVRYHECKSEDCGAKFKSVDARKVKAG